MDYSENILKRNEKIRHQLFDIRKGDIQSLRKDLRDPGISKDHGYEMLKCAISCKRTNIAELLIEEGYYVDNNDNLLSNNRPLIYIAIRKNEIQIARIILEKLLDELTCFHDVASIMLYFAAKAHDSRMVDMILYELVDKKGPEFICQLGLNPLHIACLRNDIIGVQTLLRSGYPVDEPIVTSDSIKRSRSDIGNSLTETWAGSTALHLAVKQGYTEIVLLLLLNGANPDEVNNAGSSPGMYAHQEESRLILAMMPLARHLKNFATDAGDYVIFSGFSKHYSNGQRSEKFQCLSVRNQSAGPNRTFLQFVVHNNLLPIFKLLFTNNAEIDVNCKNDDGQTPLHLAVLRHSDEMIKTLIAREADYNVQDNMGRTPFNLAIGERCYGFVNYFLNLSGKDEVFREFFDRNITDVNMALPTAATSRLTLLHHAVESQKVERVEFLISRGANVNCLTEEQHTPLHLAMSGKDMTIIRLLTRHGARVNAKDQDGKSPLHLLAKSYRGKKNADAKITKYLSDTVDLLLRLNCEIEARDLKGRTPLYAACSASNGPVADALLQNGANLNVSNNKEVLLISVVERNHENVGDIVVKHIAKMEALNVDPIDHLNDLIIRPNDIHFRIRNIDRRALICTYRMELERMRRIPIAGNVSLLDVLTRNAEEMVDLLDTLESSILACVNFDQVFPTYGHMIRLQYDKGVVRKNLIYAGGILSRLGLPDLCIHVIMKNITPDRITW